MSVLLVGSSAVLVSIAFIVGILTRPPRVPGELSTWPSIGFLYLQLARSALMRKKVPKDLKGKPIQVKLTAPVQFSTSRYAAFLKLVGFKSIPAQVPLSYPFVEAFRLSMLAMAHPDFPFSVLGSVLARNSSTMMRPIAADEALTYSAIIDPRYMKNEKGDTEILITCTGKDSTGAEVWRNTVTLIVINPKRQRGGGSKPAEAAAPPAREVLAELAVPANAGRAYGGLSGDRNPIHMHNLTSQLFGFKRPIAHAMYLVARLEAQLVNAGYGVKSFPATFDTEFKRPTLLPAKLQAVVSPSAQPELQCAVVTANGEKDVIVGRLYSK